MSTRQSHLMVLRFLYLVLPLLVWYLPAVESTLSCAQTEECERLLRVGSECVEGVCTNPFHKGGCLANMLPDWSKIRMCNSEDGIESIERGYCRMVENGLDYTEMRSKTFC